MSDDPKISMMREVAAGLDLMIEQTIDLFRNTGIEIFYWIKSWSPSKKRAVFLGFSAVAPVTALVFWLLSNPSNFEWFTFEYWKAGGNTSRSEVFRNLGLFAIAILGFVFAAWRTIIARRQTYLTEQGQITDRYAKAVEMLSAPEARTRIGGIYALSRIAKDSPSRDFIPVMDTLCEFVRNPPYRKERSEREAERRNVERLESEEAVDPAPVLCPDIHAAIHVINERLEDYGRPNYEPNFRRAVFRELDLTGLRFSEASTFRADFSFCDLSGSVFENAFLNEAIFEGATLVGTIFYNSHLRRANFRGAQLVNANLSRARLIGACLANANLNGADLTEANLERADLTSARFYHARLHNANLAGSTITSNPIGRFRISQDQINTARPSPPPETIPLGIVWPFESRNGEWMRRV